MTRYAVLHERAPGRPLAQLWWYETARRLCGVAGAMGFGLRVRGASNIPLQGPVVFVSNHQSFLDPMLCGVATGARPSRPMARESLFSFWPMGVLLKTLGIVPVNMDGGATAALRIAIEELRAGRSVTLFSEGTRSSDGELTEFRSGLALLVRLTGAPIVPMAIDGAFDAWPRHRLLPRLTGPICVEIGTVIRPEALVDEAPHHGKIVAIVRDRVAALITRARARRAFLMGEPT
ncbi:MAG: lysophospholipid acyltransferase family protein [Planctomycetota bacterium]|nr:lysophospholipid acyltransferase family protein [Planctomycetota bacterium]MDA1104981.1 lysophospholipid acyltransferase family protein [Planctomycetota bacterium]